MPTDTAGQFGDDRGLAPVAAVLMIAIVAILGGVVAGAAALASEGRLTDPGPSASLSATAEGERVTIVHRGGDTLDARDLRVKVSVNGEELARQPPVPFFSAQGFYPGPTGAFNRAGGTDWTAGETASFRIAGTNDPIPAAGDTIEVEVFADDRRIATVETTVT